jgi:hypothetical protein
VAHNISETIASIPGFGLAQLNRADTIVIILSIPVKLNFSIGTKVVTFKNGKAILRGEKSE